MNRRSLTIGVASATALASWLLLSHRTPVPPKPAPATAPDPNPVVRDLRTPESVQVRFTLVTADVLTPDSADIGTSAAAPFKPPSRRSAATDSPRLASNESDVTPTFAGRAKRALFGDGRHRPEPFPRVK